MLRLLAGLLDARHSWGLGTRSISCEWLLSPCIGPEFDDGLRIFLIMKVQCRILVALAVG